MTRNSAIKVAEYLKNGGRIGNGNTFSISFSFENGMFVKECEDMRENERFTTTYSYNEFLEEIQKHDKSEFANYTETIADSFNLNVMLRTLFQKFFKPKS